MNDFSMLAVTLAVNLSRKFTNDEGARCGASVYVIVYFCTA